MQTQKNILNTQQLSIGYKKAKKSIKVVAQNLNLNLNAGEFICLLGANGTGKSTLMRTIAGVQTPLSGEILLENQAIKKLKASHISQRLSLVLTDNIAIGNLSVYTLVSLGRTPYTGWLGKLTPKDIQIIEKALEATETTSYIDRNIDQLSDGEKQKVMIARALAQDTPLILLDEPTAHLDLPNRVMIFKLLRKLAKNKNKAILLTSHELDLALQAADKVWLMQKQEASDICNIVAGTPEDLVLNETFERAFHKAGFHFDKQNGTFKIHESEHIKVKLSGNGIQAFWTKRALEREGYAITKNGDALYHIELSGHSKENYCWKLNSSDRSKEYLSVEQLLQALHQKQKN